MEFFHSNPVNLSPASARIVARSCKVHGESRDVWRDQGLWGLGGVVDLGFTVVIVYGCLGLTGLLSMNLDQVTGEHLHSKASLFGSFRRFRANLVPISEVQTWC